MKEGVCTFHWNKQHEKKKNQKTNESCSQLQDFPIFVSYLYSL